jgi:HlyD family secretion protein
MAGRPSDADDLVQKLGSLRIESRVVPRPPWKMQLFGVLFIGAIMAGAVVADWKGLVKASYLSLRSMMEQNETASPHVPVEGAAAQRPAAANQPETPPPRAAPARGGVVGSGYAVASHHITVMAEATGIVDSVRVEEGEHVEAGHLLIVLKDALAAEDYAISASKVAEAEASVKAAKVALAIALDPLNRLSQLQKRGVVSETALTDARFAADQKAAQLALEEAKAETARREAARTRLVLEQHKVRSPITGVIAQLLVAPGETTLSANNSNRPGQGVAVLFDPASLEVEMEVAESNVGQIRRGQAADVTFSALPGMHFPMSVKTIRPISSRERGTIKVQLTFAAPPKTILPEMAAKITIIPDPNLAADNSSNLREILR